jgi:glutamate synthase (ferredoxin)
MSGGVAYVLDEAGDFALRVNQQSVTLERLEDRAEIEELRQSIQRHAEFTRSRRAWRLLVLWEDFAPKFVKIMPKDYKRVLQAMKRMTEAGLSGEEAVMAAFDANARDAARVGGG